MSNPILNKIIHDMYLYKKLFNEKASIPLDTLEWYETFDGFGIPNRSKSFLDIMYHTVLHTATENFQNHKFRLRFDEIESPNALGPNRVWLMYELDPALQE